MGTIETSAAASGVSVFEQTQVSVFKKALESSQQIAMDLVNKNQEVSREIMESDGNKGQKIDVKA